MRKFNQKRKENGLVHTEQVLKAQTESKLNGKIQKLTTLDLLKYYPLTSANIPVLYTGVPRN